MNPQFEEQDPSKPIAYDANGQPLYAQPVSAATPPEPKKEQRRTHISKAPEGHDGESFDPKMRVQYANEPGMRQVTRDIEPEERPISDALSRRHDDAIHRYPHLNLSKGEVVLLDIKRHPIGLLIPLTAGGFIMLILVIMLIFYPMNPTELGLPDFGLAAIILGLIMSLVGIGTGIAVWVYLQNQFYMTNESVIQEIQNSLFSRHEQTVSLGSIEDASFKKNGILQTMLDYGTIRLSTEGEETTYQFHYVANPRKQVAILNNGVESFKNGRPVDIDDDIN